MKTCPVCHAITFDDATVCFGCLHRYDDFDPVTDTSESGSKSNVIIPAEVKPDPLAIDVSRSGFSDITSLQPPGFCINIKPVTSGAGMITWSCAVELAS